MKRALVTGGAGFIGSHLVAHLVGRGVATWVLDAGTRPAVNTEAVRVLSESSGGRLLSGSVTSPERVQQALEVADPDVVFHLAAESHVDASLAAPAEAMRVNAVGTQVVGTACARRDVPLVYCSTDEVYGDTWGASRPSVETDPLHPSSPYSAGKAAGEMALWALARSFGLRAVITRGCNAYGPHQYPEKLVPIAARLLGRGLPVPLHGGGLQVRQWIAVEEFVAGLIAAAWYVLDGAAATGEVVPTFNLAGPSRRTVRSLVTLLAAELDIAPPHAWVRVEDRAGQDRAYWVDGDKAADVLGFRAERRIEDEVRSLLDAYPPDGEVHLAREAARGVG